MKTPPPARPTPSSLGLAAGAAAEALHARGWHFYDFIGSGGARLMCSWDTTPEDVRSFAAAVLEEAARRR